MSIFAIFLQKENKPDSLYRILNCFIFFHIHFTSILITLY